MSQIPFPLCAKLNPKFEPRPRVPPRYITHLPKPGLSVRTSCGSSSSARSRTASRAAVDDLCVAAMEADSFYDLLGISENGTMSEIRRAYKQLVLKYHPDVSPPGRAKEYTKRFIQVQKAYETLSDPTSRASYDRDMAFGGRKPFCYVQAQHNSAEWKLRWMSQINELLRRSVEKDLRHESMSWGARIRRQRDS
ncbi:J domain-containing protein [Psidium guajava]|nr:J domain-containing protein [Psidium guajava]